MGHAILERVLLFGTRAADYIRASGHNGCIATEVTLQATTEAEYMTAPERFADSQIPLAPWAPSEVDGASQESRPRRFLQRGKSHHLPRSGSRQGRLLCRFSQTVYSARKLSIKLRVALVQKRG
jgi:hypothetical protein